MIIVDWADGFDIAEEKSLDVELEKEQDTIDGAESSI